MTASMGRPRSRLGLLLATALLGVIALCATANAKAVVGDPAPEISVKTLAGDTLLLSELRGRVVLINFWASWCYGCHYEFPKVNALAAKYSGRPVSILAISEDVRSSDVQRFLQGQGQINMQVVTDEMGRAADAFGIYGIPATAVIDKAGVVRLYNVGYRPGDEQRLELLIDELLQ